MTMSDGSAEAGSPETGNGEATNGSLASASDLLSGLDEDSRHWIDANGIKADNPAEFLSGLVTKSREMESLIGRSVRLPGEDASDEEVAGFYDRITERLRPKEASGYQYELPEGLPEDMPYDTDFVDAWRDFSHQVKLPAQLSAKAHDWFLGHAAKVIEGQQQEDRQAYEAMLRSATDILQDNWGQVESETFRTHQEYFQKAVDNLGGESLMREMRDTGLIDEADQITAPHLVMALSKAGRDLFAEDRMVTGERAGTNPFAEDTKNWSEQNAIIRDDPQLARNLIRAAGKDPQTYKL